MSIALVSDADLALEHVARPRATDERRALLDGARAMVPLLAGVAPFGLVVGVAVAQSGIPPAAGWSLSWAVYGGSAQLAAIGLMASGAPAFVVVASVALISLRLALYGLVLAPHWRGTSRWWRLLASYFVIDPSFAVALRSYDGSRPARLAHRHYLGAAVTLCVGWLAITGAGVLVGTSLPAVLRLDSVGPLYLVALVVPAIRGRATAVAVAVAVVVAVAASAVPLHLGPAVSMVAGLAAGSVLVRRSA